MNSFYLTSTIKKNEKDASAHMDSKKQPNITPISNRIHNSELEREKSKSQMENLLLEKISYFVHKQHIVSLLYTKQT